MNSNTPQPLAKRGEFAITLKTSEGEREFKLKFSFQSMARMEDRIGYALTKVAQEAVGMNLKIKPIVDIFFEAALEAKEKVVYLELADIVLDNGHALTAKKILTFVMEMLSAGKDEVPAGKGEPEGKTTPA